MDYATLVFHQIQNPLTFTWNLMIRAHTINGTSYEALILYNLMINRGVPPPDKFTFPFVIKACLLSSAVDKGKEVHALAIKTGFSGDMFVQNSFMNFYFKCGDSNYGHKMFDKMRVRSVVSWTTMITGLVACSELDAARAVFELMPVKNVVSWTAMINGYATNQRPQEAFKLFQLMQLNNVRPNEFTLVSLLVACKELGSLKLGNWIHDFALANGFKLGVFLGTALIDMYSKCGSLEDAERVFDKMQNKTVATWNSMITSLGVHGRGEEALALFAEMENVNVRPDAITFVGVLCACVHSGKVDDGCSTLFSSKASHKDVKDSTNWLFKAYYVNQIFRAYCCLASKVLYIILILILILSLLAENQTENVIDASFPSHSMHFSLIAVSLYGWAIKQAVNVIHVGTYITFEETHVLAITECIGNQGTCLVLLRSSMDQFRSLDFVVVPYASVEGVGTFAPRYLNDELIGTSNKDHHKHSYSYPQDEFMWDLKHAMKLKTLLSACGN
ncbi:hypothetical protein HHK36_015984 [Tetracentron sinense]|uniref:Pentatricopeptide repeat-containing protein n=1 Tax=Tetracentron sinense TaxID=13715 RepID=A0A834Z3A9_TETSI|nr:hypothetical protein HHK36_015984 [Tetracentron sinense]